MRLLRGLAVTDPDATKKAVALASFCLFSGEKALRNFKIFTTSSSRETPRYLYRRMRRTIIWTKALTSLSVFSHEKMHSELSSAPSSTMEPPGAIRNKREPNQLLIGKIVKIVFFNQDVPRIPPVNRMSNRASAYRRKSRSPPALSRNLYTASRSPSVALSPFTTSSRKAVGSYLTFSSSERGSSGEDEHRRP